MWWEALYLMYAVLHCILIRNNDLNCDMQHTYWVITIWDGIKSPRSFHLTAPLTVSPYTEEEDICLSINSSAASTDSSEKWPRPWGKCNGRWVVHTLCYSVVGVIEMIYWNRITGQNRTAQWQWQCSRHVIWMHASPVSLINWIHCRVQQTLHVLEANTKRSLCGVKFVERGVVLCVVWCMVCGVTWCSMWCVR